MRTVAVKVYKFSELSTAAKERARTMFAAQGYHYEQEAFESLKKLAEHFGSKLVSWEVHFAACSHSSAKFAEAPEYTSTELGDLIDELGEYSPESFKGTGECVLTGYCMDESAIDGLRIAYFAGERDIDRLLQAGFATWLADCQADFASTLEDDYLVEHCEANGYEFDKDGELFSD